MNNEQVFMVTTNQDIPNWILGAGIGVGLVFFIVFIFFCWSTYAAMKAVPREHRVFPAWFCWMQLIPVVGYVFQWLMLPFGIPRSFDAVVHENEEAKTQTKTLFGVGLAYVIIPLLMWIPIINFILLIASIVLFIIYWMKVVKFKENYLLHHYNKHTPQGPEI